MPAAMRAAIAPKGNRIVVTVQEASKGLMPGCGPAAFAPGGGMDGMAGVHSSAPCTSLRLSQTLFHP